MFVVCVCVCVCVFVCVCTINFFLGGGPYSFVGICNFACSDITYICAVFYVYCSVPLIAQRFDQLLAERDKLLQELKGLENAEKAKVSNITCVRW